jgi:hypothetical protein
MLFRKHTHTHWAEVATHCLPVSTLWNAAVCATTRNLLMQASVQCLVVSRGQQRERVRCVTNVQLSAASSHLGKVASELRTWVNPWTSDVSFSSVCQLHYDRSVTFRHGHDELLHVNAQQFIDIVAGQDVHTLLYVQPDPC